MQASYEGGEGLPKSDFWLKVKKAFIKHQVSQDNEQLKQLDPSVHQVSLTVCRKFLTNNCGGMDRINDRGLFASIIGSINVRVSVHA